MAKWQVIEAWTGKPLSQALIDGFREHGTDTRLAWAWGVHAKTIKHWRMSCRLSRAGVGELIPTQTLNNRRLTDEYGNASAHGDTDTGTSHD